MNKTQHIENSIENFDPFSGGKKARVKPSLRSSILVTFLSGILIVLPTFAYADTAPVTKAEELQQLTQSIQEKKKIQDEVEQDFNHYIQARDTLMLPLCTQKFAEYQGIELSKDFYAKSEQDNKNLKTAKADLYHTLNEARSHFGKDFSQTIDQFFEEDKQDPVATGEITRGYCLNFKKGFGENIMDNLHQYQKQTSNVENTKENTLYLNSQYQLQTMTVKLDQKIAPTTLMLEGKEYAVSCSYLDVQQYDTALAMNGPIKNVAYKASDYFYNQLSPQIDHIIACTSEKTLPEKNKIAVGDTYPWSQPVVVGSNGIPAAGDSLIYISHKQVIVVLGHEPCVCNSTNEQHCNKIKKVSREFKASVWKLISALEAEKPKHNVQAQVAITAFTSYARDEIKKESLFY